MACWIAAGRWGVKRGGAVENVNTASSGWSVHSSLTAADVASSTTRPHRGPYAITDRPQAKRARTVQYVEVSHEQFQRVATPTMWHEACSSGFPCPVARWVARREASNPSYERRAGVQARNLVRVGDLVPGKPILAPAIRRGPTATGSLRVKVAGGGNAKAVPRCEEGEPGGGKAQEGRGSAGALTGSVDTALPAGSKALKSGAESLARVTPQALLLERQEGMNRPAKAGTAPRGGTNP